MTRSIPLARVFLCLLLAAVTSLSAHAAKTAWSYYESARTYVAEGNYPAAVIQLRNAIQQDPGNLPSRVLLGKVYLLQGEPVAAEKELRLALGLGGDPSLVLAPLGNALILQRKYEKLFELPQPTGLAAEVQVELLTLRAQAQIAVHDLKAAETALQRARDIDPADPDALLAQAVLLARQDRLYDSRERADQALQARPTSLRARYLLGEVESQLGNHQAALEHFDHVLSRQPKHGPALLGRAREHFALDQIEAAAADLDQAIDTDDLNAEALFLRARIYTHTGQHEQARASLNRAHDILQTLPTDTLRRHPPTLLLRGTIAYFLGHQEQAISSLEAYRSLVPTDLKARKLLARAYLRQGKHLDALQLLAPLELEGAADSETLVILGEINLRQGDYALAQRRIERAMGDFPEDPYLNFLAAQGHLGAGDSDAAYAALQAAVWSENPELQRNASLLSATLLLRRNQAEPAIALAKEVLATDPGHPLALNLLGSGLSRLNDWPGARSAFERAVAGHPDFLAAHFNLARLDVTEGHPERARQRYEALLASDANRLLVLTDFAALEQQLGNRETAKRLLEQVHTADPTQRDAALRLARLRQADREWQSASEALDPLLAAHSDDFEALAIRVRGHRQLGQNPEAITKLQHMAKIGSTRDQLLGVGRQQIELGAYTDAFWTLDRLVQRHPDWLPGHHALAATEIALERDEAARRRGQSLVETHSESPVGHLILGDLAWARAQKTQALQSYREAYRIQPSRQALIKVFQTQSGSGDLEPAIAELRGWLEQHPDDYLINKRLALALIQAERYEDATKVYESLLNEGYTSPDLLNNLAMLYDRQGDRRALSLAQEAYSLAPRHPGVTDTLGWQLIKAGQNEKGLQLLREAAIRDARSPTIKYHLSVALDRNGQAGEARRQLQELMEVPGTFPEQEEARTLLRQLSP